MNIEEVSNYLIKNYGFEETPCTIPSDDWEYNKMNVYVFTRRVSLMLFKLLLMISPIKRLVSRPDGSIWLKKYLELGLCEIELKDPSMFTHDQSSKVNVRVMYSDVNIAAEVTGNHEESIEKLFYLIPELRMLVRQRKISSLTE
jgi:hypothetical protein